MLRFLCPAIATYRCLDIEADYFTKHELKGLILDVDNTLVPWGEKEVSSAYKQWLQQLQQSGIKICLLSNNRNFRVEMIAATEGILFVSKALKPSLKGFKAALALLKLLPRETAVMGDQLYTDILGGNLSGCHTIWVKPLSNREFLGTKITRFLEKITVAWLRHKNMLH
ncbi:MAG: YqeG family HAD IIIA-type phosphatase [Sporomusaceae bacterium]|nr:YqeG family HAD IIIA-type phosphatase [Sporomusaceae bacterium]